ncbi:hypothetical protein GCM10019060_10240 [Novosphingobium pokkalii]|nr:hypothetical protein GCM10019060_10240 [Novosphingobium pokkalii]
MRVLIVPPLFDEMNRARAMLVAVMRDLAAAGIASVLPDLPGCGESVQDFAAQSLNAWRAATAAAARHFGASHVLALRGGALVAPPALPGWALDPLHGDAVLRPLLRAAALAARARGEESGVAALLEQGRAQGLVLGGYRCGAALIAGLQGATMQGEGLRALALADLAAPGPAPWLRQEPAPAPALAAALAARVAQDLGA